MIILTLILFLFNINSICESCDCNSVCVCYNGGYCVIWGSWTWAAYGCHCPPGYGGAQCEIYDTNACSYNPCLNGGFCQATGDGTSYICNCPSGYSGDNCTSTITSNIPTTTIPTTTIPGTTTTPTTTTTSILTTFIPTTATIPTTTTTTTTTFPTTTTSTTKKTTSKPKTTKKTTTKLTTKLTTKTTKPTTTITKKPTTPLQWQFSFIILPLHLPIIICSAKCAIGKITPIPGTRPSFNGCGPFNITVDFSKYNGLSGFNTCCNQHDICYYTCSKTKSVCDTTFFTCLKTAVGNSGESALNKIAGYTVAAQMYDAVKTYGCPAYIAGLDETCYCA